MERPESVRRLIVNADDFGRSQSINEAVIRAHREGILTTASLMVNEPDCAGAVKVLIEFCMSWSAILRESIQSVMRIASFFFSAIMVSS